MSKYEELIEDVQRVNEDSELFNKSLNAAEDAMAFVLALHEMFKENGVDLPEEPDLQALENVMDGVLGELAAACLFLSENSFEQVPKMLRIVSNQLEKMDSSFKDPDGVTGPSVPLAVRKGFSRLADRIEATRVQKQQMISLVKDLG